MPKSVKKPAAPVFAKGTEVQFEMDEDTLTGVVTKILDGNEYQVKAEDGIIYECEEHELKEVEKKPAKKGKKKEEEEDEIPDNPGGKTKKSKKVEEEPEDEEEEEEDEDEKPTKKGKKKASRSLADAFNDTPVAEGGGQMGFPLGSHAALCIGGDAEETEKGVQLYFQMVGVDDDKVEGCQGRKYYNITTEEGEIHEGAGFFKADFVRMGMDEDLLALDPDEDIVEQLKSILKKVKKEEPYIAINVKPQKGNTGYNNIYINGLMEDQDDKPDNPLD